MTQKIVFGIDPGLDGAIVQLDNTLICDAHRIQGDIAGVLDWLVGRMRHDADCTIYVEKQYTLNNMKQMGQDKRLINYGKLLAYIELAAKAHGRGVTIEVAAPTWRANIVTPAITSPASKELDSKEKSALAALKIFGSEQCEQWLSRPRASGLHDGLADAACIAMYGVRMENSRDA